MAKEKIKRKTIHKNVSNQAYLVFEDPHAPGEESILTRAAENPQSILENPATLVIASSPMEAVRLYEGIIQGESRLVVATIKEFTAFVVEEDRPLPTPFTIEAEEYYGEVTSVKG